MLPQLITSIFDVCMGMDVSPQISTTTSSSSVLEMTFDIRSDPLVFQIIQVNMM